MNTFDSAKIVSIVNGRKVGPKCSAVSRVLIDSRLNVEGALFVALKGERFDGHDFVLDVEKRGAKCLLVERSIENVKICQIVVPDTLEALWKLAAATRQSFLGPVVAVTGSSGKTTTRNMIASILKQKWKTHVPIRNFNNHIGVPLTILNLEQAHEAMVLELGCSDFNEIGPLTRLCEPTVALVTNVGPAHLEKLGDLKGVAKAKGEMFLNAPKDAVAALNQGDPHVASMDRNPSSTVTFGEQGKSDVYLTKRDTKGVSGQSLSLMIEGEAISFTLPLAGEHNAKNAVAAAAVAKALDLSLENIKKGLEQTIVQSGRLVVLEGIGQSVVIDDTYNANPASTIAAIDVLCEMKGKGRSIAVLADMLELGEKSREAHDQIGKAAFEKGVDLLFATGEKSQETVKGALVSGMDKNKAVWFEQKNDLSKKLVHEIQPNDVVLVKGSRGMAMEKVVERLLKED